MLDQADERKQYVDRGKPPCICGYNIGDPRVKKHSAHCQEVRRKLASYDVLYGALRQIADQGVQLPKTKRIALEALHRAREAV